MITAAQISAAHALIGIDQCTLAEASGLSVPTIQRMETSDDIVHGQVDSLMKVAGALDSAGSELIDAGADSRGGGCGVRLKRGASAALQSAASPAAPAAPRG